MRSKALPDEAIDLKVPASLGYRSLVIDAAKRICQRLGERGQLDGDAFEHATVSALGEAFNNIVQHSYADNSGGIVTIHFRIYREALEVELLDHGIGFDIKAANIQYPGVHESGMGLFIMHSFMDEVEHRKGQPNRLRLKKFLPEPAR